MMKKLHLYLFGAFAIRANIVISQICPTIEQDLTKPITQRLISIPNEIEAVTEKVLIQTETKRRVLKPAVYDTISTTVMISPKRKKQPIKIPAVYETVTETIMVKPERKRLIPVPSCRPNITETIMIKPESKRIVGGREEIIPAEYRTITKQLPEAERVVKEEIIPAEYQTVPKLVRRHRDFCVREEIIPAEYRIIAQIVLKTPAIWVEEIVPAQYQLTKRIVLKKNVAVQITPTFVTNKLHIEGAMNYQIVNLSGQIVLQSAEPIAFLQDLPTGLYLVCGKDVTGNAFSTKIVKQ